MALPPQKFREAVFQMLYSQGFESSQEEDLIPFMMHELKTTRSAMAQAHARAQAILAQLVELDAQLAALSTEYAVERISGVEKTILRLALFEMGHDASIPPKVAIAEAIRLCRKFGTPESAQFVNAILDKAFVRTKDVASTEKPISV